MKMLMLPCILVVSSIAFAAPTHPPPRPSVVAKKPEATGATTDKKTEKVSLLFLVTASSAVVKKGPAGLEISIPVNSNIVVFTDRPYRLARALPGGLRSFAAFFERSNFKRDLPNVTLSGTDAANQQQMATIMEMSQPTVKDGDFVMKIQRPTGSEQLPPEGTYSNVSLVVDSVWSWLVSNSPGLMCTLQDAATLGRDTADCVKGVTSTIGAPGGSGSGN